MPIVRYFKFGKKILFLSRTCLLNEAYLYLPLRGSLWLNVRVHDRWLSFLMDGLTGTQAICISSSEIPKCHYKVVGTPVREKVGLHWTVGITVHDFAYKAVNYNCF